MGKEISMFWMSKKISEKIAAEQVAFTCKIAFKQHGIASNAII